jgi:uncharacterized protein (UPF0548 family)
MTTRRLDPADLAARALTYAPVGRTLDGPLPPGFHHLRVERRIGTGASAYERAADAVMGFGAQRGAGLRPSATAPRAAVGVDLLAWLGIGPLALPVPCRVVWAVEGPHRTGFGYGTLAGHVESGEEAFVVERRGEAVYAVIRAYSVPVWWPMRASGAVGRALQRGAALLYLHALRRSARERPV